MHHLLWPVCALALMTAACDNGGTVRITSTSSGKDAGVLKVVDALQCPQTQGVLTRKGSAQADGTTCVYSGPRGSEVTLQLVSLNGRSVQDALKGFENRLSADLPEAMAEARANEDRARAEAERAEADAARAEAEAERAGADAERAATDAANAAADSAHVSAPGVRIDAQGDKATIRLPGMRIDADGDRANIKIGGITIRADDKNSQVNIRSNSGSSSDADTVTVDASDRSARIRTSSPGEAVRASFLMTADQSSTTGWRVVGYEARGPSGGPIVVATVRGKDRNENRVFEAAKALVTLNVGD